MIGTLVIEKDSNLINNCFKAAFKRDGAIALVSFYFEREGFITTVYPTKFNNKELLEEIKLIVNRLKECNQ